MSAAVSSSATNRTVGLQRDKVRVGFASQTHCNVLKLVNGSPRWSAGVCGCQPLKAAKAQADEQVFGRVVRGAQVGDDASNGGFVEVGHG